MIVLVLLTKTEDSCKEGMKVETSPKEFVRAFLNKKSSLVDVAFFWHVRKRGDRFAKITDQNLTQTQIGSCQRQSRSCRRSFAFPRAQLDRASSTEYVPPFSGTTRTNCGRWCLGTPLFDPPGRAVWQGLPVPPCPVRGVWGLEDVLNHPLVLVEGWAVVFGCTRLTRALAFFFATLCTPPTGLRGL